MSVSGGFSPDGCSKCSKAVREAVEASLNALEFGRYGEVKELLMKLRDTQSYSGGDDNDE